jgi:hypothetical protein
MIHITPRREVFFQFGDNLVDFGPPRHGTDLRIIYFAKERHDGFLLSYSSAIIAPATISRPPAPFAKVSLSPRNKAANRITSATLDQASLVRPKMIAVLGVDELRGDAKA